MGIIIRQSVKSAFWTYLGIAVGYINVGIIMPQFFDTAQMGLVQLFASVSLIFAQFGTLGFTSVINRLFPVFRNPRKYHHGFLFLTLVTGIVGFALTAAGFIILKPWIVETNIDRSPLLVDYLWLMLPLVFMRLLFTLLDNYNKMLYDTVTGTFWLEFMHKVINLFLIVLFALGWLNFSQFFVGYILSLSLPVLPVVVVLIRRHHFSLKPQLSFITKELHRDIRLTMSFGFVNGISHVILWNVDKVFVNQYLSLSEVGIFGVCVMYATLIRVPYVSISRIAGSIIAEAWKRDDRAHIREIYQKAALNQAIIGTLFFVGLLANLDNIFQILPPGYQTGKWVLIIYSAGMLINTIIGLAGNITETSKHYRFTTFFLVLSIGIQFGLSMLLVPPLWNHRSRPCHNNHCYPEFGISGCFAADGLWDPWGNRKIIVGFCRRGPGIWCVVVVAAASAHRRYFAAERTPDGGFYRHYLPVEAIARFQYIIKCQISQHSPAFQSRGEEITLPW